MRFCKHETCDEAATIYFRGPWCAVHALQRFGKRDIILAARFSELHRALEASRSMDPCPPQVDRGEGSGWRPNPSPVSRPRGRASAAASVTVPEPSPISDQELDDLLETEGWSEWEGW